MFVDFWLFSLSGLPHGVDQSKFLRDGVPCYASDTPKCPREFCILDRTPCKYRAMASFNGASCLILLSMTKLVQVSKKYFQIPGSLCAWIQLCPACGFLGMQDHGLCATGKCMLIGTKLGPVWGLSRSMNVSHMWSTVDSNLWLGG